MPDIPDKLQTILTHKLDEVAARKRKVSPTAIEKKAAQALPTRGFTAALKSRVQQGEAAIIAECKKASPSRGVIRENYHPAAIARDYEKGGATCLSVLTDTQFFQGSDDHLKAARAACKLPVLRKDFIIDPYQIHETRALGADCILLIVAALDDQLLREFAELSQELGMDVLVEIHNREELERALLLRTELIGINNRDLRTFSVDLQTTLDLLTDVFPDRLVVTESGIKSRADVARMRSHDVHAFLVGEALMTAKDPGAMLRDLFSSTEPEPSA